MREKKVIQNKEFEDKGNFADDKLGVPKGRLAGLGRSERNRSLKEIRDIPEYSKIRK